MQADAAVLRHAVVEAARFPGVGEERHGDRLAEVVELQAGGPDSVHDGGVVDRLGGDGELAGAQEEVGVCRCAAAVSRPLVSLEHTMRRVRREFLCIPEGIANHQESDIELVRAG